MTENMIVEEKTFKDETCESGETKVIEKTEITNCTSLKCNTLERKIESVVQNISKRSEFNRNFDLTTSILSNFNLRNRKIAPIVNSCIKELLLRTDVDILQMLNAYYTKGKLNLELLYTIFFPK